MKIYIAGYPKRDDESHDGAAFIDVTAVKREGVESRPFAIEFVTPSLLPAASSSENVTLYIENEVELDDLIRGLERLRSKPGQRPRRTWVSL